MFRNRTLLAAAIALADHLLFIKNNVAFPVFFEQFRFMSMDPIKITENIRWRLTIFICHANTC